MTDVPIQFQRQVAVLTHYLPPYIAMVFQHLKRRVPNLQLLLSIPQEPNRNFDNDWGELRVEVQRSMMIRRPWKHGSGFQDELYIHFPYDTFSQLCRIRPEIILSYELGFRSLASALYRRTHRNCRLACCVCVSEHTEKGRGSGRWLLRRTLLKLADGVTYNGPSCRRYLESHGVRPEKLHHLPYAAHDQYRTETGVQRTIDADRRLICVGQFIERKGVLPMIAALADYACQRPQQLVDLSLVGGGPLESAVREFEVPQNLKIELLGHVDPTQVPDLLRQFGVLVFPTLADEWGMVVNEAMHTGMPVIGSQYAQACTTLIQEGENGWTYSPDLPNELHAKLDRFFSLSSEELLQVRFSAQQSVQHITSAAVAGQILEMFQQLSRSLR